MSAYSYARWFMVVPLLLGLAVLACGGQPAVAQPPATVSPAQTTSVFDQGRTAYGFFPTPPEVSLDSIFALFKALGQHADVVLVQQNVPWQDFVGGQAGDSQKRTDIRNLMTLAGQQNLKGIFVVDALNGLNRREFMNLPAGWPASFADPRVRSAYTNFALWIVSEFHPRYLGLASEINTYADAHPDDFPNFLSLYRDVYAKVKAASPGTQVFVTFQWEELNSLFAGSGARQTNWAQIETFEPELDVWAISSYPFFVYKRGADIPADYYQPLLERTRKPLAVAEGGYTSAPMGALPGTPQDQVDYLDAIHNQIGGRLTFWIYLLLDDFNAKSYASVMTSGGSSAQDLQTLSLFTLVGLRGADGAPKPALAEWDRFRAGK